MILLESTEQTLDLDTAPKEVISARKAERLSHHDEERTGPSDEELMAAVGRSDPDALAALYDRYGALVKSVVMRIIHSEADAEDLLQEIFVEIWNVSANYCASKGKVLGWIITMSRRRSIDRLRKKQSYARVSEKLQLETEQQPEAWVTNSADEDIERNDVRKILSEVLSTLPPAQMQVIELAFYRGMSQREIAAHTNIPLGTIKTRIELGLKKISAQLQGLRLEF